MRPFIILFIFCLMNEFALAQLSPAEVIGEELPQRDLGRELERHIQRERRQEDSRERPVEIDPAIVAWDVSGGHCDFRRNPHTFACNEITFNGQVFPLFDVNWSVWRGDWFAVTYVNGFSGHEGAEFFMAQNPNRPQQPMGVFNVGTGAPMGVMSIQADHSMVIENWVGITPFWLDLESVDPVNKIAQWRSSEMHGYPQHAISCRDFNRNNKHHLLCRWAMLDHPHGQWHDKGFFGFLLLQDWLSFQPAGPRR